MTTYSRPGVYINELPLLSAPGNSAAAATAAGAVVAAFAQGPDSITKVTSWYEFSKRFGGYSSKYPATFSVGSFFKNGGTELYVRRILAADATQATLNVPVEGTPATTIVSLRAKHPGADGNNIRVKFVQSGFVRDAAYYDMTVYLEGATADTTDDIVVEQFNGLVFNDANSGDYIASVIEFGSQYVEVTGDVNNTDGLAPKLNTILPLTGALDPESALTFADYTGDTTFEPGVTLGSPLASDAVVLQEFEVIDQPLVFFFPDVINKLGNWTTAKYVFNVAIDWAELNRHVVIVETQVGKTVPEALAQANDIHESSRAAVYYPHVFVKDPIGKSGDAIRKLGPSGAVAGIYLATDRRVGPFKTPAGIEAKVADAIAIERAFTPSELDALNSGDYNDKNPINAIRNLPGAGVVVMGGRTTKQDGTANRYVNMRRSLIFIEKRLNDLAQFAIFENNSEELWSRLVTTLGSFLNEYRNQGGLRGTTVEESYYIKCDEENNTPATIAAGEVHVEIGVALEYPAEFVVINLSQKTVQ